MNVHEHDGESLEVHVLVVLVVSCRAVEKRRVLQVVDGERRLCELAVQNGLSWNVVALATVIDRHCRSRAAAEVAERSGQPGSLRYAER